MLSFELLNAQTILHQRLTRRRHWSRQCSEPQAPQYHVRIKCKLRLYALPWIEALFQTLLQTMLLRCRLSQMALDKWLRSKTCNMMQDEFKMGSVSESMLRDISLHTPSRHRRASDVVCRTQLRCQVLSETLLRF